MTTNGPIMFGETFNHNEIAKKEDVTSAGFFSVMAMKSVSHGIEVLCFGESFTLGVKSKPTDALAIKSLLLNIPVYLLDE